MVLNRGFGDVACQKLSASSSVGRCRGKIEAVLGRHVGIFIIVGGLL